MAETCRAVPIHQQVQSVLNLFMCVSFKEDF